MKKSLLISEQDSIAALLENERAVEFFVNRGELLLGDIYSATVENILPGIDAAFVNLGKDKMGFLHANDVPGQGPLKERLVPKQKLLVQITKEPTGHKGPRVSTAISLPGRFLVLVPEERGVSISRRISEARERSRLKSVVNLMKPPGVGLIIRTEAKGQAKTNCSTISKRSGIAGSQSFPTAKPQLDRPLYIATKIFSIVSSATRTRMTWWKLSATRLTANAAPRSISRVGQASRPRL